MTRAVQRWSSYLLTVFGAATLLTSPLAGWVADKTSSRKLPFLFGLFLQATSTFLFLVSPRVEILLIARAFQGLSAAVVYSVGMAVLVDTVGISNIGTSAGYFLSSSNMGVLVSPTIGGLIYSKAGYDAVAMTMVSLVAFDIILRLLMLEKSTAKQWSQSIENEEEYQPITRSDAEYGTMSDAILPKATKERRLPAFIRLLANPRALSNMYAVLVCFIILSAFDAGLPVFVKQQFDWPSSSAGASFLAIALPSLLSPIGGAFSEKYGPRWVTISSFVLSAIGLSGVGFILEPTVRQLLGLYVLLGCVGSGVAFVLPCAADDLTAIANTLHGPDSILENSRGAFAQAFALFNCGIAGGTVIGPLWMSNSLFGWQSTTIGLAFFAISACLPIFLFNKENLSIKIEGPQ